jgi:hypothetical protein
MRPVLLLAALLLFGAAAEAGTTCTTLRKVCTGTAGTTWTEFVLPAYTASVVIEVSGAAYVDGPAGGYTDGAARSSGGRAISSGESLVWPVQPSGGVRSIWVAGDGSSRTVTLIAFGAEAQ